MVDAFSSRVEIDSSTSSSPVDSPVAALVFSSSITREQLEAALKVIESEIEREKAHYRAQDEEQRD